MSPLYRHIAALACVLFSGPAAHAQISLQSAVDLALKNSPKVRGAQADLDKANAAFNESRDAYVPAVVSQGGYGQSTGAPLGVPVVFSISAQSLIFSFSQRDYIRSAQQSVQAARHALHQQQIEVVEDTTNTYLALDNAAERQKVLAQQTSYAVRLVQITSERVDAGVDAQVELPRSRRTATQIRLLSLQLQDEIAGSRQHLSTLTGLPAAGLLTEPNTVPQFKRPAPPPEGTAQAADGEGIQAAYATARAKEFASFGDRRYLLRPQVTLATNYSRVDSGLSSYASYYPRFAGTPGNPNSQNSLSFGLEISLPLLDLAHRAKAQQSTAEAARAFADADAQRGLFREGRARLQHSALELDLRAELARDDQEIAQDQLEAINLQLQTQGSAGQNGPQLTPKDQLNAQLQERQRYLDLLTAQLQLQQTQVNLLRQTDGLSLWISGSASDRGTAPAVPATGAIVGPGSNTPALPGTPPLGTSETPTVIPTPGLPPASLPNPVQPNPVQPSPRP